MPDVVIEKGVTLDLLDQTKPDLSSTSDKPIIETKPDVAKPAAAPDKAQDADDSATPDKPADAAASAEPKKPAQGVQKRIDELTRQRETNDAQG